MLNILFHPRAKKELLRLPKNIRRHVLGAFGQLELLSHPLHHPKVLKLSGRSDQDFRLRVGSYRIKFTLQKGNIVLITHVEHRQAGY